jgi:hypothetical protein
MINKKSLPLELVKTIEDLFNKIREFVDANSDIIYMQESEELEITIFDLDLDSNFQFRVFNPIYNSKSIFRVEYSPKDWQDPGQYEFRSQAEVVLKNLNTWTSTIREYNKSFMSQDSKAFKFYQEKYYESFGFDDDGDTPYEYNDQLLIENYLLETIAILEKNVLDNQEIILNTIYLKDNIQTFSKRQFGKQLARILAKIHIKSLPLIKEVLKITGKELVKKGVNFGIEFFQQYLTNNIP